MKAKVIGYISEENNKLFDVSTMTEIIGTSRSKIQRELKRNKLSEELVYNNKNLYSENVLFTIMESILWEKLEKINEAGGGVAINWHYEEDDEDMLEAGEDYQAIINIPFKMVEIEEE